MYISWLEVDNTCAVISKLNGCTQGSVIGFNCQLPTIRFDKPAFGKDITTDT